MKNKEPDFTPEDVKLLIRSVGKPPSPSLRAKVMAKIDQIDRDTKAEKTTPERERTRDKPAGQDSIE